MATNNRLQRNAKFWSAFYCYQISIETVSSTIGRTRECSQILLAPVKNTTNKIWIENNLLFTQIDITFPLYYKYNLLIYNFNIQFFLFFIQPYSYFHIINTTFYNSLLVFFDYTVNTIHFSCLLIFFLGTANRIC